MISKKELLKKMNISYGQLYRWKREGLIPDEWFIKQSVSTGQETYFNELLIIPRIKKILDLKDKYQLDELRNVFVSLSDDNISIREAILLNSIDPFILKQIANEKTMITFNEVALCYIFSNNKDLLDYNNYKELINIDFSKKDLIMYIIDVNKIIISSQSLLTCDIKWIKEIKFNDIIDIIKRELKGE